MDWWIEKVAKFFITPVILLFSALLLPGVSIAGFYTALIVAIILGFLNIFIRPILIILSLPITIITFGLFIFVVNALLLWFVSSFISGFAFSGFLSAFVTALLISIGGWIGDRVFD